MYVRICSIMEKSKAARDEASLVATKASSGFEISNPSEKELALAILRMPEQLDLCVSDL